MPESVEAPARHHLVIEAGRAEVTFARPFTEQEQAAVHDALVFVIGRLDAIYLSVSHLVKVTPVWDVEEDGTQLQTNRPLACPDCNRELVGASGDADHLRCPVAAPLKDSPAPAWGDVVACGFIAPDPTIVRTDGT